MNIAFRAQPLRLRHTFTVAGFSRDTTPCVRLLLTHNGITVESAAAMPPYLGETEQSVMQFLAQAAPIINAADPYSINTILDEIEQLSPDNNAAKAALDIALHKLLAELTDTPLHAILGVEQATPQNSPPTTYTIGIDTPEVMQSKVLEVAGQFKRLKVKVGLGDAEDRANIAAIRAVTRLPLTVDANQGWRDREQALDMTHWLATQNVLMVEQPFPVAMLDDTAWLTARSPIPIFADESVRRLSDLQRVAGAFSGVNIKLMKSGGLREAVKMLHYARRQSIQTMLGCMTEPYCTISAAEAITAHCAFADLDGHLLLAP